MATPTRPDIGRMPCPLKGCNETAAVRRSDPKKIADPAGGPGIPKVPPRIFASCPVHGKIWMESNAAQDYLLEHAEIDGAPRKPAKPDPEPPPRTPAPIAPAPARAPAPVQAVAPEKKRGLFF